MSTLNKEALIEELTLSNDVESKAGATRILALVLDRIKAELKAGNDVKLAGFINLKPAKQAAKPARDGRNPSTGAPMRIEATPEKNVVRMSTTAGFKAELNA